MATKNIEESIDSYIAQVNKLRDCWELASVLNFLTVFKTVIGGDLKMTGEDIETGLIKPDIRLAQLHITLLKGIPPVSKNLDEYDVWVTAVCKKLAMWWPWAAEGEIPLKAANGEEISRYRELNPTSRLLILKALCEVRADQNDAVSYVNDALKYGTPLCCFRKDRIGEDGDGTSYWYDGNTAIGHRLYMEVTDSDLRTKCKGGKLPAVSYGWKTLATNIDEFRKVADELSYSKIQADIAVGSFIETDVIHVLEKQQKKKARPLKMKHMQEMQLSGSRNSCLTEITRSCRNEYDKKITQAIRHSQMRKTIQEQKSRGCHSKYGSKRNAASTKGIEMDCDLWSNSSENNGFMEDGIVETGANDDKSDSTFHNKDQSM